MKSAIAKSGVKRKFVSPSFDRDVIQKEPEGYVFTWKEAVGLSFTVWALKNFPKTTLLSLAAAGLYMGMNMKKDKNPFHGTGIVRTLH